MVQLRNGHLVDYQVSDCRGPPFQPLAGTRKLRSAKELSKFGVIGFEPTTSWSRSDRRSIPKSAKNTAVFHILPPWKHIASLASAFKNCEIPRKFRAPELMRGRFRATKNAVFSGDHLQGEGAEHVRGWLFGSAVKQKVKKQPRPRTKRPTKKQYPGLRIYSA